MSRANDNDLPKRLDEAITLGYYLLGLWGGAAGRAGMSTADMLAHAHRFDVEFARLRGAPPIVEPPPRIELSEASADTLLDFVIWQVRSMHAQSESPIERDAPGVVAEVVYRYMYQQSLATSLLLAHEVERLRLVAAEARAQAKVPA